jgi:hypothetical protein
MKKTKFLFGMFSAGITFTVAFSACDNVTRGGGASIIAKWYSSQEAADSGNDEYIVYEFTSDRRVLFRGEDSGITYTLSGNKITANDETLSYSVDETVLTLNVDDRNYAFTLYKKPD